MLRNRVVLLVVLTAMVVAAKPQVSWAWGDGGHMLVAMRAWDAMTPEQRAGAVALIKQHPRFESDFIQKMPPGLSAPDQDLWLFIRAATWPDYIWQFRTESPKDFREYFHAAWHVIGQPVALDPQMQDQMKPTNAPSGSDVNRLTIREALPLMVADLDNTQLPAARRAVALCWVMHLTGDLHQPCHCASLFCKRFSAPEGDHVGLKLNVLVVGKTRTMHSLWDAAIGYDIAFSALKSEEGTLLADAALQRDALPELTRDTSINSWIQESLAIAMETVYDKDVRAAIAAQETDATLAFQPVVLSDEYLKKSKETGRRRGALAGLRLADLLAKVQW